MAGFMKNAMSYLGMSDVVDDEDDYIEEDEEQKPASKSAFDSDHTVTPLASTTAPAASSTTKPFPGGRVNRITTIHPKSYEDAQLVGRALRDGVPVVLNLTGVAEAVAYRIVDFSAGVVFGVAVAMYTGALLGVCKTFPLWNNALLPILFLVSAVSTGMASVLVAAIIRHPEEFNRVGVLKKFHFCLPIIELVLIASLCFITANDASGAGAASVAKLIAGTYAPAFWVLLVIVGLVLPTVLETRMLFFTSREFETSRKAHWISFASDVGVLVGGFVLRLLILRAALPITMVVPWV